MVYKEINNFQPPETLQRTKYEDVGVYNGVYSSKVLIYESQKRMVSSLCDYVNHIGSDYISIAIGVSDRKLFFIENIHIKISDGSGNFVEILLDLKGNLFYPLLEKRVMEGVVDNKLLKAYEDLWKTMLYTVFCKCKSNCDDFLWEGFDCVRT